MNQHGKCLKYSSIHEIGTRDDYLDSKMGDAISRQIENMEPIAFMGNDVREFMWQPSEFGRSVYVILITGVLLDGRRANVVLNGIEPHFELQIPDGEDRDEFAGSVVSKLEKVHTSTVQNGVHYSSDYTYDFFEAKPLMGYQPHNSEFMRLKFTKLVPRSAAITALRAEGYTTMHDDTSSYYRVVARDHDISYSAWTYLNSYSVRKRPNLQSNSFEVTIENFAKIRDAATLNQFEFKFDKTVVSCWDIETYTTLNDIPRPENETDHIFMISMTFHWYYAADAFIQVLLVSRPCDPHPDFVTILCTSEKQMIKAAGEIWTVMKPEFIIGFNDSDYDWPWLVERADDYKIFHLIVKGMSADVPWSLSKRGDIHKNVYSYHYRTENIKMEASRSIVSQTLAVTGCINVDVRTIFRQKYPTSEKSGLNFFLAEQKLPSKKDMEIKRMKQIYRESLLVWGANHARITPESLESVKTASDFKTWSAAGAVFDELLHDEEGAFIPIQKKRAQLRKDMREIADYCVTDAFSCHRLFKIRSIILEMREIADRSYTSLYDSFYRANGCKVRNMVIAKAQRRGYRLSNLAPSRTYSGKYPGGYVVRPRPDIYRAKASIDERIANGQFAEWKSISLAEAELYKGLVRKYGAIIPASQIADIEKNENITLPECVKKFLTEVIKRPVTGLDFSSLYPSLIMTYNLSPEKIVRNKKTALDLLECDINIKTGGSADEAEREKARADSKCLYRIEFPLDNKRVRAWSIPHHNSVNPNDDSPDNPFGVCPSILKCLYDDRTRIRAPLKSVLSKMEKDSANRNKAAMTAARQWNSFSWEERKKHLLHWEKYSFVEKKELMDAELDLIESPTPEFTGEYNDVCYSVNSIGAKQVALKIFMNTFYGEMGNKNSSIGMVEIAGGTTTAGQRNLKAVIKLVLDNGWSVCYGDTDSAYVCPPHSIFDEIDRLYYGGKMPKLEYYNKMVEITFVNVRVINKIINDWLKRDNGSDFLMVMYEEILYPKCLFAPKVYVGIPHISIPNFSLKELFVRGIAAKKRGACEFLKDISEKVLHRFVDIDNVDDIVDTVKACINQIYDRRNEWPFEKFIKTIVYRPPKGNKPGTIFMNHFAERMKIEGRPVVAGDRFNFVYVKKYPYKYDYRGKKSKISVGDRMEYASYAVEKNLPIDLDYYMESSINGALARFITSHSEFHVEPTSSDIADIKIADIKMYKKACKWVSEYCNTHYEQHEDKGKEYQSLFRKANTVVKHEMERQVGVRKSVTLLLSPWDEDNIESWLMKAVVKASSDYFGEFDYGAHYVQMQTYTLDAKQKSRRIATMRSAYMGTKGIANTAETLYRCRKVQLLKNMYSETKTLNDLHKLYESMISRVIECEFAESELPDSINAEFRQNFACLDSIYSNLLLNEIYITKIRMIARTVSNYGSARYGIKPDDLK